MHSPSLQAIRVAASSEPRHLLIDDELMELYAILHVWEMLSSRENRKHLQSTYDSHSQSPLP